MSLRTGTYPASADNDPPSPCSSGTIIRRHEGGLLLPWFLLSHYTGSERPSHHGREAEGEDLPRAPALCPASSWADRTPGAASACRVHRNVLCHIRASPWELGTRASLALPEGITPAVPEGLGGEWEHTRANTS